MSTLLATCVLLLVSAGVGQALLSLAGRADFSWTAPAIGFAALVAAAPIVFELPGHPLAVALLALAVAVFGATRVRRPDALGWAIALVALALAWLAVPFLVNGRFGMLGVSFNDDTRFHLWAVEHLARGSDVPATVLFDGYPLGPHTVAGVLAHALGTSGAAALNAVLATSTIVAGLAAFGVLRDAAPARRLLVGLLVALPYLLASYYAQGAFKETILAALVLAFTVELREVERSGALSFRAGIPFGVLVAGAIAAYTYPALLWFGAVTVVVGAVALVQSRFERTPLAEHLTLRGLAAGGAGAALILVITLLPKLASIANSFTVIGSSPASSGAIGTANIGNLVSPISLFAVFSQWPIDDFRYQPHGLLRDLMVVLGVAVAAYGAVWWSRRRDLVIPAGALTVLAIFLLVRERESAYVSAKALCVAAPLVMLMGATAITARPSRLAVPALAVAGLFAVGAGYSTFLTLRTAQVGAGAHERELASFQPLVDGHSVLYLSTDNFSGLRLFGADVTTPPIQSPIPFTTREGKAYVAGDPIDFDFVDDATLDRFDFVVTTSADYGSTPPPNFRLVRSTPSFRLYRRTGPTPPHQVLPDEGKSTGARLDCDTAAGRALARSGATAVVVPEPTLFAGPGLGAGATASADIEVPAGEHAISLQYRSPQPLVVTGPGLRTVLPASLDGLGPYWRVGTIDQPRAGTVRLTFEMDKPSPLFSRSQYGTIPSIAVSSTEPPRRVPVAEACGEWVDALY